jgi:hypothetical protein
MEIPAGSSRVYFHLRDTRAGTATISATAPGLTGASQVTDILPGPVAGLLFTTAAQSVVAGYCSAPVTVTTVDTHGNAAASGAPTSIALGSTGTGSVTFHLAAGCAAPGTAVQVPAGSSSASFWFMGFLPGAVTVRASLPTSTASQEEVIEPGSPVAVGFLTPPRTVRPGACSDPVRVVLLDAANVVVPPAQDVAVDLTANPANLVAFHGGPTCQDPVTRVTIPAGLLGATLHLQGLVPGETEVRAAVVGRQTAVQPATVTTEGYMGLHLASAPQSLLVGECSQPVLVELRDWRGQGVTTPADTLVTVMDAWETGGPELFGDDGCTQPLSQVVVPASSLSASFHVRGQAAGTLSLALSSPGMGGASQQQTIRPSVRGGTCLLLGGAVDCAGPLPVIPDRTVLWYQATSPEDGPGKANVLCRLTAGATVSCARHDASGGAVSLAWQTSEHARGVIVRRYQPDMGTVRSTLTITSVDPARTFLVFSATNAGITQNEGDYRMVRLVDATHVETAATVGVAPPWDTELQVVEHQRVTVTRGVATMGTNSLRTVVPNLGQVDATRTALLYSWSQGGSGVACCPRMLRGEVTSPTALTFSRGDGVSACAGEPINDISWERVQFDDETTVRQVEVQLPAGVASTTVSVSATNADATLVLAGGQWTNGQSSGEGSYNVTDIMGEMQATFRLQDPTQVSVTRGHSVSPARWTLYVVRLGQ